MKTMLCVALIALLFATQRVQAQWEQVYGSGAISVLGSGNLVFAYWNDHGMVFSIDECTTWFPPDTTMRQKGFSSLLKWHDNVYAGSKGQGLFRTADSARSWSEVNTMPKAREITSLLINERGIVTGTASSGVWRSSDFGSSWVKSDSGILHNPLYPRMTTMLFSRGELYLGTLGRGVYRWLDSQGIWIPIQTGLSGAATGVYALAECSGQIFAGTAAGVFILSDTGYSWHPAYDGMTYKLVVSLAVSGTTLFAGTQGGDGVYRSSDLGTTWSNVTANMQKPDISALAVTRDYLVAGTYTSIWRRPLSELISGTGDALPVLPEKPTLAQNYPNPFSHSSTFTFTLPSRMRASLRVYSLLGREIATLAEGEYEAGAHTVSFDASSLPVGGVYVYRLAAGATLLSGRMAFVR